MFEIADCDLKQHLDRSGWSGTLGLVAEAAKKAPSLELVPVPAIQQRILLVREQHVMVDEDLAELYGVATRRLIEQVKRNRVPFPPDFMFQLSRDRVGTPGVISGAPARVVGEVNAVVG